MDGVRSRKKKKQSVQEEPFNLKKEIWEWAKVIVTAVALAFVINTFLVANSVVPSESMENTIMTGDRIIGSRLAYRFGKTPQRGDIVIFDHPIGPGSETTRLVKRIIGLPGETVEIRDNQIYIDGAQAALEEPYLHEAMMSEDHFFEIPQGCYLMLGDNRNRSADARYWPDPYVPEEDILAQVMFRYYPRIGKIE